MAVDAGEDGIDLMRMSSLSTFLDSVGRFTNCSSKPLHHRYSKRVRY